MSSWEYKNCKEPQRRKIRDEQEKGLYSISLYFFLFALDFEEKRLLFAMRVDSSNTVG